MLFSWACCLECKVWCTLQLCFSALPCACCSITLPQGYACVQGITGWLVSRKTAASQLRPAYTAYITALNNDNSLPATLIKLAQAWLAYSTLWQLMKLLRLNVLLRWSWHTVLGPMLLGLFWQPSMTTTVRLKDRATPNFSSTTSAATGSG
jgi:hypothetical protein